MHAGIVQPLLLQATLVSFPNFSEFSILLIWNYFQFSQSNVCSRSAGLQRKVLMPQRRTTRPIRICWNLPFQLQSLYSLPYVCHAQPLTVPKHVSSLPGSPTTRYAPCPSCPSSPLFFTLWAPTEDIVQMLHNWCLILNAPVGLHVFCLFPITLSFEQSRGLNLTILGPRGSASE